jgi:purine-nucleoside phosphorylase
MKKLYGDFTKEDWLRTSQMTEDEVPHTVILHGEDGNITENIAEWEPSFESILKRPRWNMFIGNRAGKRIGFVNVCWAPMAALIVHKFAAMGTKRFIQIGYCGGLISDLKYGELVLVTSAKAEDGVANQYISGVEEFHSSTLLLSRAEKLITQQNYPYKKGRIVSTSAMFLETSEVVKKWQNEGFIGVDGETATTLAVAQKFNAEAISVLTCSDNLALGDNYYESNTELDEAQDKALEIIQALTLQLA